MTFSTKKANCIHRNKKKWCFKYNTPPGAGTAHEGGQQSGVRPLPPPPVVRLQSSHETLLAVDSLEAEGRFLEAAELLAERLQQIKAAADQHAADVPELPAEEGAQPARTGSGGRLRRAWSAMASAWSVLRGYEEPPML